MKGTWWSKDEQAPIRKSQEGCVASPIRLEVLPVKLDAHPVGFAERRIDSVLLAVYT
jgi:hypothetical protein